MSDQPTPPKKSVVVRIQQTVESIEGEARMIGVNIIIEQLNLNIILRSPDRDVDQSATASITENPDAKMRIEVNNPNADILAIVEPWLKAIVPDQEIRIELESSNENDQDNL